MTPDSVCDRVGNTGNQPWILERGNWRVGSCLNLFELVMAVEIDLPADFLKLFDQTGFDEMNRALIDAQLWLQQL